MLRSWYAVYTKPQKELKVSSLLSKKGVENFCPLANITKGKNGNTKTISAPLFDSHLFVYIQEKDLSFIKNIPGVISILYWKTKPAIINSDEIDAIKTLNASYTKIKIERIPIDHFSESKMKDESLISFHEKTVSVKCQVVRINLPSLGYSITAERSLEDENFAYQETGVLGRFPKRINAFFFN